MTVTPGQLTFDAAGAIHEADAGMARASRADRVQEWKAIADQWLDALSPGELLQADTLVALFGLPDEGVARNNVVGAWFAAKAKAGRLEWTGEFAKSERTIGHGNLQRVWRVK